jgi:hypothetical protein
MSKIWKSVVIMVVAIGFSLSATGCKSGKKHHDHPHSDHPKQDHPRGEHPEKDHPHGEHPE